MGKTIRGECRISEMFNLRGGTRKVGKQERNRRKNEGERAGKKNIKWSLVKATRPVSFQKYEGESGKSD